MKKVAIGCGAVLLLAILAIGIIAVLKGPEWFRRGKQLMADEMQRIESVNQWNPSADTPEALFPSQLGSARRLSTAPSPGISALDISHPGQMAAYDLESNRVEVHVIPVTQIERAGLTSLATNAHERTPGARTTVTLSNQTMMKSSLGSFLIAHPPGRMVIMAADRQVELGDFSRAFFAAPVPAGSESGPSSEENVEIDLDPVPVLENEEPEPDEPILPENDPELEPAD
jgi:hypothetical protein